MTFSSILQDGKMADQNVPGRMRSRLATLGLQSTLLATAQREHSEARRRASQKRRTAAIRLSRRRGRVSQQWTFVVEIVT